MCICIKCRAVTNNCVFMCRAFNGAKDTRNTRTTVGNPKIDTRDRSFKSFPLIPCPWNENEGKDDDEEVVHQIQGTESREEVNEWQRNSIRLNSRRKNSFIFIRHFEYCRPIK